MDLSVNVSAFPEQISHLNKEALPNKKDRRFLPKTKGQKMPEAQCERQISLLS